MISERQGGADRPVSRGRRVSVVIPCHNTAAYLAQTIGSVLDQSRPASEIIVVDNRSTDASVAIARTFEARFPDRIRVLTERGPGAPRARNTGALAASGDALMFLDSDDVLGPEALDVLIEALEREPDGVAACEWSRLVKDGAVWVARPASCLQRDQGEDPLHAWLRGRYYPPCAMLWSRSAFERAGRWDEHAIVNQDGDIVMRALAMGVALAESDRPAAYYRRRPAGEASVSGRRMTARGSEARMRTVLKVARLLEESDRLTPYRAALAEAFACIAADVRPSCPEVSAQALALARQYRPRLAARLGRRARSLLAPFHARPVMPGRARPPAGQAEVRFGRARADFVLRSGPACADVPPPALRRPAVSVVIPTYNRAPLLRRALDSVLRQTFRDFEVLVVDDGSTDETAGMVAELRDVRIRYLRQSRNSGVGAARNRGLREARAELIAFLDSDDEWLPEKLALQVALFSNAPDALGLVYTGVESVRDDGRRTIERPRWRGDVFREMLAANVVHGGGSNVMIRRAVVATVGFFHEQVAAIEDYHYWLRIARFFRIDFVDAPLIRYYDTTGSAERRSLALGANLDAREWFYRKYAADMQRAGVAHLFLLKSVRRALFASTPDIASARRLALRAVIHAPTCRPALEALGRTLAASVPAGAPGAGFGRRSRA